MNFINQFKRIFLLFILFSACLSNDYQDYSSLKSLLDEELEINTSKSIPFSYLNKKAGKEESVNLSRFQPPICDENEAQTDKSLQTRKERQINAELITLTEANAEELTNLVQKSAEHLREFMEGEINNFGVNIEQTRQRLNRKNERKQVFGIKYNNKIVGIIGIQCPDEAIEGSADFYYWRGDLPETRSIGIISNALSVLVSELFSDNPTINLKPRFKNRTSLNIVVKENNIKSKDIPKRIGFKKVTSYSYTNFTYMENSAECEFYNIKKEDWKRP